MSDNAQKTEHSLVIPGFGETPKLELVLNFTREGENRTKEAKDVTPVTYTDLESCFSAAWRELNTHLATLGFQIGVAEEALETAKSTFLIDDYPEIIKDMKKSQDSADLRKAYLMRYKPYTEAMERINMLKAMQALLEGKLKNFERTSSYMKKKMDLIIKSGLSNANLYPNKR